MSPSEAHHRDPSRRRPTSSIHQWRTSHVLSQPESLHQLLLYIPVPSHLGIPKVRSLIGTLTMHTSIRCAPTLQGPRQRPRVCHVWTVACPVSECRLCLVPLPYCSPRNELSLRQRILDTHAVSETVLSRPTPEPDGGKTPRNTDKTRIMHLF